MSKYREIGIARSKKNGVVFSSTTFSNIGVETYRDALGRIQSKMINTELEEVMDSLDEINNHKVNHFQLKIIILDIVVLALCIAIGNYWQILAGFYFVLFLSTDLFEVIRIAFNSKSKKGKYKANAKFHSAEHKAINAYERIHRIPTIEEVKKESSYTSLCGSTQFLTDTSMRFLIFISMIVGAIWNGAIIAILIISCYCLVTYLNKRGLTKYLQFFVTSKPSNYEIEVMIEGLKNFEEMEDKFNDENNIAKYISFFDDPLFFYRISNNINL